MVALKGVVVGGEKYGGFCVLLLFCVFGCISVVVVELLQGSGVVYS
jgi:hypothetical protein